MNTIMHFLSGLSLMDWLGVAWFVLCWGSYEFVLERGWKGRVTLLEEGHRLRLDWARQMLVRENRIVDAALVGNLVNSVSFYANTSIYIVAGLFATLGALDQFVTTAAELPFARAVSREALEFKLLMLIGVYVIAYFKFTWSLRQFNVLSIVIGAVPPRDAKPDVLERFAQRMAMVNTCAGDDFNRGIRAYYFGMAVLAWMLSAWAFIILTTLIMLVQTHREFNSPVLKALRLQDELAPTGYSRN